MKEKSISLVESTANKIIDYFEREKFKSWEQITK